ncbi:hypothetical protein ACJJTC_013416 [Scirpophaga incertulas]
MAPNRGCAPGSICVPDEVTLWKSPSSKLSQEARTAVSASQGGENRSDKGRLEATGEGCVVNYSDEKVTEEPDEGDAGDEKDSQNWPWPRRPSVSGVALDRYLHDSDDLRLEGI